MASIWITEYETLAPIDHGTFAQCGLETGAVTTQQVTYSASTASAGFGDATRFVRVEADALAHIEFGSNPTATTASKRIQANVPEYFGVIGGQKIAAYDGAS